jgi:DNA polymerase-3 subunit delta'
MIIFDQIKGHQKTIQRLKFALTRRPLPKQALLFCGPGGVGKKLAALGWAQGILCAAKNNTSAGNVAIPCGLCGPCVRVANKSHPDILFIEPGENASLKIDQIRDIQNFVSLRAYEGQAKVVIIDESHSMTLQAANGLLKTLEEPPSESHFVLITSNRGAVISTVQSRCQRVLFGSLTNDELKKIIPDLEPWIFELAQGRADLAQKLCDEGYKKWRTLAVKVLRGLDHFRLFEGFTSVSQVSGDKECALFAIQCWLQLFKAAAIDKPISLAHSLDEKETIEVLKNTFSIKALLSLGLKCLKLEQDVLANINKGLAFEQFFIEAQSARKDLAR